MTFTDKETYLSSHDFTVTGDLTYSRVFPNTNWQALYVPFSMNYDKWKQSFDVAAISNFHEYTDENGTTVKTELEVRFITGGTLKPNHPYLIRAKEGKDTPQTIALGAGCKIYASQENSIDCSSVERLYTFTGTYAPIDGLATKEYYFMSGGKLLRSNSDTNVLAPQRWYLTMTLRGTQLKDESIHSKPAAFNIKLTGSEDLTGSENPTGIKAIGTYSTPLPTNDTNATYDLGGMRCSKGHKGIVINNGRKYLVK